MKGQMFILAALVIIIGIIFLKTFVTFPQIAKEKEFLDEQIPEYTIRNIVQEYGQLVGLSSLKNPVNTTGIAYLSNFSSTLRNDTQIEILYLYIVVNSSTQKMSVTLGNYLNEKINATLNATNATPSSIIWGELADKTNQTAEVQATMNGTINVTLSYVIQNTIVREQVAINSSRNTVLGLFDVKLRGPVEIEVKDVYNQTW